MSHRLRSAVGAVTTAGVLGALGSSSGRKNYPNYPNPGRRRWSSCKTCKGSGCLKNGDGSFTLCGCRMGGGR